MLSNVQCLGISQVSNYNPDTLKNHAMSIKPTICNHEAVTKSQFPGPV